MQTLRRFLLVITGLAVACPALAQDEGHRFSMGASFSGLGLYDETGRPKTSTGIGGWVNVVVKGPLSVEGRVSWFPTSESVERQSQGGRTFKLTAGARGMLIESRRFALSGILQPGIIRFSNTAYRDASGNDTIGPQTHFAMDMGGTLELFPRSRVSPRVDVVQTLYVVPGAADPLSGQCCEPQAVLAFPGKITDTLQFSVGVDYKLGTKRREPPEGITPGRWTIGAQFVHAVATSFGELSPFQNPGAGAFASYRAFGPVYADAAVSWHAHEQDVRTPWDGGRVVQALAGVAVGPRRAGVGLFFKARAGIGSHAEAYAGRDSSSRTLSTTRSNNAALDFGGIIELDVGRRTIVRIEMSDLIEFYGTRTITIDGVVVPQPSLESKQNMQMSIGMGWRF